MPVVPQVAVHRGRQAWTSAQPVPQSRGNGNANRISAAMLTAIRSADFLTESREMRVARGDFDPAITEKPADDRQALAERERPRGKGVAKIVQLDNGRRKEPCGVPTECRPQCCRQGFVKLTGFTPKYW